MAVDKAFEMSQKIIEEMFTRLNAADIDPDTYFRACEQVTACLLSTVLHSFYTQDHKDLAKTWLGQIADMVSESLRKAYKEKVPVSIGFTILEKEE